MVFLSELVGKPWNIDRLNVVGTFLKDENEFFVYIGTSGRVGPAPVFFCGIKKAGPSRAQQGVTRYRLKKLIV